MASQVSVQEFEVLKQTSTKPILLFYSNKLNFRKSDYELLAAFERRNTEDILVAYIMEAGGDEERGRYRIEGIPTCLLFHGGIELGRLLGHLDIEVLESFVEVQLRSHNLTSTTSGG